MDELIAHAVAIVRAMWRHRWAGLLAAWAVGVLGAAVLLRMPDRYEATARVYVDTKSVLAPLMKDLAVEPDIDQTIVLLARRLITRPNVELLMSKSNMDPKSMTPAELEQTVAHLTREIQVAGSGRDNVFSFSYRHSEPSQALLIVSNLVSLFVESDLGAKQRDTEAARQFIDEQIQAYEVRLAEAENRLKDFKVRNLGVASANGDYFARMSALSEEKDRLDLELRAVEQSRDALKQQLSREMSAPHPDAAASIAAVASPELSARLEAQRKTLDELLRRYTDLHPDVVVTRKLIARLEQQVLEEAEAQRRNAATQSSFAADPALQQVKLALAEAEAAVAGLRVRAGDTKARLAKLKASALRVPQIEAELSQLNRDYEVVRRNYDALVGKREKASLSGEVDGTRLASFRVIDPPRTAARPVFPNRLVLAPLVLVVALATGAAVAFLASQLFPTFDSARALRGATQRPVAGTVSMFMNAAMARRARRRSAAFATALGGLVMGYGAWIVSMMPLTVAS